MLNDESLWKAVHRLDAAAENIRYSADRIEESVQKLAYMLEPGYGGTALQLIEELQNLSKEKKNESTN